ncbi:MAG: hypothetical protein HZB51_00075 [Chloroflexi bacterium]|nr:hypothetical protein [Chloroflexota bacterium]
MDSKLSREFKFSIFYFGFLTLLAGAAISCSIISTPAPPASPSFSDAMPLVLGNTWMYQVTRYEGVPITEIITATHLITDTIVERKNTPPYFIAQMHREESAETSVGFVPPSQKAEPLRPATSSEYWWVLNENRLYRQERKLDLSKFDESKLEFVFPLEIGKKWNLFNDGLARITLRVGQVTVPAGRFDNCFLFDDAWASDTAQTWFCPRIGIVEEIDDHHGTPMGWHTVLIRYNLAPSPK